MTSIYIFSLFLSDLYFEVFFLLLWHACGVLANAFTGDRGQGMWAGGKEGDG